MRQTSDLSQSGNMQLKYCERCGQLWLRPTLSARTLCSPCARAEVSLTQQTPVSFLRLWSRLRAEARA